MKNLMLLILCISLGYANASQRDNIEGELTNNVTVTDLDGGQYNFHHLLLDQGKHILVSHHVNYLNRLSGIRGRIK